MNNQTLKNKPHYRWSKQLLKHLLAMAMGFLLVLGGSYLKQLPWGNYAVFAQYLRPEMAAEQIYLTLTYIPKENEYISKETGKVAPDNTLMSRFIRYHQDIKKRPVIFRIDWQLTLADYLGYHEQIKEERYPGRETLTSNPMEADVKAIQSLNRRQRQELVDFMVKLYTPKTQQSTPPTPNPQPTPQPSPNPNKPPSSRPGDADLLK